MQTNSPRAGSSTWASAEPRAAAVSFSRDALVVQLDDGRTVSVPLDWYPQLRDASPEQRGNWRLIAKGYGIHWPDLDEDVCVPALLGLPD